MNPQQSKQLADHLNDLGVILYSEVNGIQHKFKLSLKELSPASVIYRKNKQNIEDPDYTLIPVGAAHAIYNIGKKLFDTSKASDYRQRDDQVTGYDYVNTTFGRYVSQTSLDKVIWLADRLVQMMRERADELVSEKYEDNYRDAFLFALRFFSREMTDFRDQLRKYEGEMDLFWSEVKAIYKDLREIEQSIHARGRRQPLSIKDLPTPELRAAFKLRFIPQTYKEYRSEIRYRFVYTGFHPMSFENWEWNDKYLNVNDIRSVRKLLFPGSGSGSQLTLFAT